MLFNSVPTCWVFVKCFSSGSFTVNDSDYPVGTSNKTCLKPNWVLSLNPLLPKPIRFPASLFSAVEGLDAYFLWMVYFVSAIPHSQVVANSYRFHPGDFPWNTSPPSLGPHSLTCCLLSCSPPAGSSWFIVPFYTGAPWIEESQPGPQHSESGLPGSRHWGKNLGANSILIYFLKFL